MPISTWFNPALSMQNLVKAAGGHARLTLTQRLLGVYYAFAGRLDAPQVSTAVYNEDAKERLFNVAPRAARVVPSQNHMGIYDVLTLEMLYVAESVLRGHWITTPARRKAFAILAAPLWLPLVAVRAMFGMAGLVLAFVPTLIVHLVQAETPAVSRPHPVLLHRTANFQIDFSPLNERSAPGNEKSYWKITELSTFMLIARLKHKPVNKLAGYASINIAKPAGHVSDIEYYRHRAAETIGTDQLSGLSQARLATDAKTLTLVDAHPPATGTYFKKHVYIPERHAVSDVIQWKAKI